METLPAIVLTKDSYRPFTTNMIASYDELWPAHPLEFLVPYQSDTSTCPQVRQSRITFVRTRESFQETILCLIAGMDEDAWVYFCIDDKFPTMLHQPLISDIFQRVLLGEVQEQDASALGFTRARKSLNWPGISINQYVVFAQPSYRRAQPFTNFWFHQLLRVKVLRGFFQSLLNVSVAKDMDGHGKTLDPPGHFFTTRKHGLSLAESTSRGRITATARESLDARGIEFSSAFLEGGVRQVEPIFPRGLRDQSKLFLHDLGSSIVAR